MINLANRTNNPDIDAAIQAIISIYEATFPKRVRGYFLVGSYSDDSAIASSDIDMQIVFKDAISDAERARCDALKFI